ncbi:glucosyl-3-phosphoglycerate synthase [Aeromicrobium sp.]|uniref:glucosyl-3-phosphoglycerate synthase n=1 Tax=Aeromicrobium sp. TaxID=1871063 RepID=UPI003D6A9DEB
MFDEAAAWFRRRTLPTTADPDEVARLLDGRRVSVVLPARNEEATIGPIVKSIRKELVEGAGLVHEVIVVDSRSTDATAQRAASARATVYRIGPRGRDGGKGGAMQTGLARMSGDLGVFLDADVVDFDPAFVVRLLHPLLRDPSLVLVKGFYDRPLMTEDSGGGRVTELVARPLLRRYEPRLLGFTQPLAGECAFVREPLLRMPFVSGYGVEIGMLLQLLHTHGLDALAQVDLGVRRHSHQDLDALARMTVQLESAVTLCLEGEKHLAGTRVAFFRGASAAVEMRRERIHTWMLPPLVS